MTEQIVAILLVFWSAANTTIGLLILFILRDLRDRITHLERVHMGEPGEAKVTG